MNRAGESIYRSEAWKKTRNAYYHKVGGLCERCYAKGIVAHGEIVHHKIHLTKDNVNNPEIALCFDNLELLCRKCHAEMHPTTYRRKNNKRYYIDKKTGKVHIK